MLAGRSSVRKLRVASLCSGYEGIFLGIKEVFGDAELVFVADNDPDCNIILGKHFPGVPNLGDLKEICYDEVEPVDLLAAGFPCQDVSLAGSRKGLLTGNRSGLWHEIVRAIDELHPPLVFIENTPGLYSAVTDSYVEPCEICMGDGAAGHFLRALPAVLGDLSSRGYDAEWLSLRASDIGAPHQRDRIFLLAAQDSYRPARG
jgi:DNA (cytosine-5)-methyltransferase 1